MRDFFLFIPNLVQKILFTVSRVLCAIFVRKKDCYNWVIGVDDMASMVFKLGSVLPNAKTVALSRNQFYDLRYDYQNKISNRKFSLLFRAIYGPILLGYLVNKSNNFWYIWSTGFLIDREFEFKALKALNKKVITMFVGDDIRSPKLLKEHCSRFNLDTFIDYVGASNPGYVSEYYEHSKKSIASIADRYADVIFSSEIDQSSYLKSKQHRTPYLYDEEKVIKNASKFDKLNRIKILHAPSSPFVKGTSLVRSAIKRLKEEGYDFEYIELQNVSNTVVMQELKSVHIVLNQFYAFLPGVFGIEGMANHCAVLQSADVSIEPNQPVPDEYSWLKTGYWEIYDNLKLLLDNPHEICKYADGGVKYVSENLTYQQTLEYIDSVLKENGISL